MRVILLILPKIGCLEKLNKRVSISPKTLSHRKNIVKISLADFEIIGLQLKKEEINANKIHSQFAEMGACFTKILKNKFW